MKRAPFLGAGAAVLLAGCGGHHVMRALPGVAPLSVNKSPQNFRMEPAVADAIPDNVLAHPLLGEARRFDGATAPPGWALAQGQTLEVAGNRQLFSILGRIAGGDGKNTFMLPKPPFGLIVAMAGSFPTSPAMLVQSGRRMTASDSRGPGARAVFPRTIKPSEKAVAELAMQRRLSASAINVGPARSTPLSPELRERITQAHRSARADAIAQLSASNRARLDGAISAVLDGRINLHGAATEMQAALTNQEADALLRVDAAMIRQFNDRWDGNPNPNLIVDAADFLISVAITPEQAHAIYRRERSLRRR